MEGGAGARPGHGTCGLDARRRRNHHPRAPLFLRPKRDLHRPPTVDERNVLAFVAKARPRCFKGKMLPHGAEDEVTRPFRGGSRSSSDMSA